MSKRKLCRALLSALLCLALLCPALALAEEADLAPVEIILEGDPTAVINAEAIPDEDGLSLELDEGIDAVVEDIPALDLDLVLTLDDALTDAAADTAAVEVETGATVQANEGEVPLAVSYSGTTLTKEYDCSNNIFKKNSSGSTVYAITVPNAGDFSIAPAEGYSWVEDHADVQIDVLSVKVNADGSSRNFPSANVGRYTLKLTFGLKGSDSGYYAAQPVYIPAEIIPREVVVTPRPGLSKVFGSNDPVYKQGSWLSSAETTEDGKPNPLHQDISGVPGYGVPVNTVDGKTKLTITNGAYLLKEAELNGTKFFPGDGFLSREPGENVGRYRITLGDMDFGPNFTITLEEEYFTITPRSLDDSTVDAIEDQFYTGKAVRPVPKMYYNGEPLVRGVDFTTSYDNKKIGKSTVTVTGIGNFTGRLKLSFTIIPAPTAISKLTAGKGRVTVSWKRTSSITGYQISYSQKPSFAGQTKKSVKGATKSALVVKGLTSKKNYYFRIRTYKTIGSKTYYSDWSTAKKVRVK